jgi:nitrate reductase NapE component
MDLTYIPLLTWMLVMHLIADFPLQPLSWVKDKARHHAKSRFLLLHALLHGVLAVGVVAIFGLIHNTASLQQVLLTLLAIGVSHYLIDLCKVTLMTRLSQATSFLLDQGLHFLVIIGLWLVLIPTPYSVLTSLGLHITSLQLSLVIIAYLLIYLPMGILIGQILSRWLPQMPTTAKADNDSLLRAGKQIGYLERTLILTFVLLGQIPAIGFLLAAKSIFRFGDLRQSDDKMRTEYVLLGTLFSFTLTIMLGLLIKRLL